jgi:hypothetical protein
MHGELIKFRARLLKQGRIPTWGCLACLASSLVIVQIVDIRAAYALKTSCNGSWHWAKRKEELALELRRMGSFLEGRHSAVGQNGTKVDEVDRSDPPSLTGEVAGTTAIVKFKSGFHGGKGSGRAKLVLRGDVLYWQVLESSGEFYLPLSAKLTRSKEGSVGARATVAGR